MFINTWEKQILMQKIKIIHVIIMAENLNSGNHHHPLLKEVTLLIKYGPVIMEWQ
jgi:hypothetical protein